MTHPMTQAQAAFDALPEETQTSVLDQAAAALGVGQYSKLTPAIALHGEAVWAAVAQGFPAAIKGRSVNEASMYLAHLATLSAQAGPLRPWLLVAGLDATPKLRRWSEEPRKTLKIVQRQGDAAWPALRQALAGGSKSAHRAALYGLLAKVKRPEDIGLFVEGLGDSLAEARATCAEALAASGPEAIDAVLPQLKARKKGARLGAAEALITFAEADRATRSEAILAAAQAALAKEKSEDVCRALEAVITACGGALVPAAEAEAAAEGEGVSAEAILSAQRKAKPPKIINLAALPPLKERGGATLSEGAVKALIGRLRGVGPDGETDEIAATVRPLLDDESAEAWGLAVWEAWHKAGSPAAQKWALFQCVFMGGAIFIEASGLKLDNMVYGGSSARAYWYLEVFRRLAHPRGLSWLLHWAWYGSSGSLAHQAKSQLKLLARERGKSLDALLATVPPHAGAGGFTAFSVNLTGQRGPVLGTLDYGPRQLNVVIDGAGKIMVEQPNGKRSASAPKAAATDDARKAATAANTLRDIKKRVKQDHGRAIGLLEDTLLTRRSIPWATVRDRLLPGPVMGPMLKTLGWSRASDGALFRIEGDGAEAQTLDVGGQAVAIADDDRVRLLHPADLDDAERAAWRAALTDQPFEQIERAVYVQPTTDRLEVSDSFRPAPRAFLKLLEAGGWVEGEREDYGGVSSAKLICPEARMWAEVYHSGYWHADLSGADPIEIKAIYFQRFSGEVKASKVPPAFLSEVARRIQAIGGEIEGLVARP